MKKIWLLVVALMSFVFASAGVSAAENNCLDVHVHNGVISVPKGYNYIKDVKLQLKDANGNIKDSWKTEYASHKILNLSPGDYVLEVLSAPDDIDINKKFNVTINKDATSCVKLDIIAEKTIAPPIATPCVVVNVYDESTHIPTTASAQHLKGVKVQLKKSTGEVKESWESDGKAHLINALEPGEYLLEVTGFPVGYEKAENVKITINEDDECQTKNIFVLKEHDSNNTQGSLQVYTYNYNTAQEDKDDLCKTGGSKSVFDETACLTKYDLYEGATIEIFDQTGKLVTSWTTSKNDNPKVINNLSVGSKYTAIIKSIKNGELKKEHKGEVTIPNNGSAIIRFVVEEINDTKNKVKVNVRCYDKSGDEFSSKVEFKILDKDNNEIGILNINGSNVKTIELEPGTYTLVEKNTPNGYTSDNLIKFTITEGDTEATVSFGYDQIPETSDFSYALIFGAIIICIAAVIFMFTKIKKQQNA